MASLLSRLRVRRSVPLFAFLLILFGSVAGALHPAAAQSLRELGVSDDEIRNQRRATGNSITFCVNAGSLLAPFERDLAAEIAGVLLIDFDVFEVNTMPPTPPYDFRLYLDDVAIFRLLARSCDALMGYTLLSIYPDWLRPSPVYLTTPTVLAVRAGEYRALTDIPVAGGIGTRSGSLADNYLSAYLRTLPEDARWPRTFYSSNEQLIERLVDHTLDAILIWQPALLAYEAEAGNAGAFDVLPQIPFTIEPTQFVMALRPQEQFIELSLGQAIAELTADGTIERLAVEHGLVPLP